jgi:hypothetical protein
MKQFVNALPNLKIVSCTFSKRFLICRRPKYVKEGVFVGPDTRIKNLMFDEDFPFTMAEVEREAWIAFKSVVTKFLGNNKDSDYVVTVANMLEKFEVLGCLMRLKNNFLNSHLEFFPKILVQ